MLTMFKLEILKLKRRKFIIPIILITIVGLFWFYVVSVKEVNAHKTVTSILLPIFDLNLVNCMIYPILIALLCSQLIDIEHKGNTLGLLKTSNQSILKLFIVKTSLAFLIIFILSIIQVLFLFFISNINELSINYKGLAGFFIGFNLSSVILIILHTSLSLFIEKQAISIVSGLIGSFIGLFTGGMLPIFIKVILPWQYYALLNPVKRKNVNHNYIFIENPNFLYCLIFSCIILILEILLVRILLKGKELK